MPARARGLGARDVARPWAAELRCRHERAERRHPSFRRYETVTLPCPVRLEARAKAVRHTGARPRAPAHSERWEPRVPSRRGEAILIRICSAVVRQLGVSKDAVNRCEEHEVLQLELQKFLNVNI